MVLIDNEAGYCVYLALNSFPIFANTCRPHGKITNDFAGRGGAIYKSTKMCYALCSGLPTGDLAGEHAMDELEWVAVQSNGVLDG